MAMEPSLTLGGVLRRFWVDGARTKSVWRTALVFWAPPTLVYARKPLEAFGFRVRYPSLILILQRPHPPSILDLSGPGTSAFAPARSRTPSPKKTQTKTSTSRHTHTHQKKRRKKKKKQKTTKHNHTNNNNEQTSKQSAKLQVAPKVHKLP